MLNNELYNLLIQLVEENKALWRINNMYENDAKECQTCSAWWEKMKVDKEEHVRDLRQLIKEHLNNEE